MAETFFSLKLKTLRRDAGLSLAGLAALSGLSRQAIDRYERGDREPTWASVQALSAALGVSCEQFVEPPRRKKK
jgi:transcriptional regulator with XRE-family HTH domain